MSANAHPRAASKSPNPLPHLRDRVLVCIKPPPRSPFFRRRKEDRIKMEGPGGGAYDGATRDIELPREPAASVRHDTRKGARTGCTGSHGLGNDGVKHR
jgi:hypothetical protein